MNFKFTELTKYLYTEKLKLSNRVHMKYLVN